MYRNAFRITSDSPRTRYSLIASLVPTVKLRLDKIPRIRTDNAIKILPELTLDNCLIHTPSDYPTINCSHVSPILTNNFYYPTRSTTSNAVTSLKYRLLFSQTLSSRRFDGFTLTNRGFDKRNPQTPLHPASTRKTNFKFYFNYH